MYQISIDTTRHDTRYIHTGLLYYRRSNQSAREDSQAISLSTLSNCPEQNLFTRGKKYCVGIKEKWPNGDMYAVLGLSNELFLP